MRALSISELERESGVSRSLIYSYVHRGLLPPAQKASATRGIYFDEHVALLGEIEALKAEGLSVSEIKGRLAPRVASAGADDTDLVARQAQERRDLILEEAARQFAEKGYARTRIVDIVGALELTPQQLYDVFPTKHHLFVACYQVFTRWMGEQVEPQAAAESDPAARMVWRMRASVAIRSLSPDLEALAQMESVHDDGELQRLIRATFEDMLSGVRDDLEGLRDDGVAEGAAIFDEELLSFALLGAFESMLMRASWDDDFTVADAMRNLEGIFLALEAVYLGRADIGGRMGELSALIEDASRARQDAPVPDGSEAG